VSQNVISRVDEERLWRGRLEDARSRRESARNLIRGIENDRGSGRTPSAEFDECLDKHDDAVRVLADPQSECCRVLEIYRSLVLDGQIPRAG
jgi:hypothetical protein